MSNYTVSINARELLEKLEQGGVISQTEAQKAQDFITNLPEHHELPLYVRILVGVGAFISSICFLVFLGISQLIDFDSKAALLVFGVIFVVAAICIARSMSDKDDSIKHTFLTQISFCIMAIGKMLFVGGVAGVFSRNEEWGITVATLVISAATYHVFQMSVDRFLSSFAFFTSLFISIVSESSLGSATEIIINLSILIQVILAATLFTLPRIRRAYIPLAYALVFSICIMVITLTSQAELGYGAQRVNFNPFLLNFIFAVTLAVLIGWAAGDIKRLKSEPLIIALIGVSLLGAVSSPGIILSISLMVLGYAKHERLLWLLGLLLLPVFLFLYYYNLETTLLLKSLTLIGSGMVLLIGRGYLAFRRLDREVIP